MSFIAAHHGSACDPVAGSLERVQPGSRLPRFFFRALLLFYAKFISREREKFLFEGKSIFPSEIFISLQNFFEARRNIAGRNFVYTGAALYRAAQGEIQKKPRGGSRGVVTRSFSGR